MSWIKDIVDPKSRNWEEFYRNRNQCDKVVRSTHGVNCTGSCSWNVHVCLCGFLCPVYDS